MRGELGVEKFVERYPLSLCSPWTRAMAASRLSKDSANSSSKMLASRVLAEAERITAMRFRPVLQLGKHHVLAALQLLKLLHVGAGPEPLRLVAVGGRKRL